MRILATVCDHYSSPVGAIHVHKGLEWRVVGGYWTPDGLMMTIEHDPASVKITHEYLLAHAPGGDYAECTWDEVVACEAVHADAEDPVLVEASGWYAEADDAEVHYEWAATRQEAAQDYVDSGAWHRGGDQYVDIYTYRTGYVYDRASGEMVQITVDREPVRIPIPDDHPDDDDDADDEV